MSGLAPIEPGAIARKVLTGLPWVQRWNYMPDGETADLTGYSATMVITAGRSRNAPVVRTLTSTAGDIVLAASRPNIVVTIAEAVTGEFTPNPACYYRLTLTQPDGTELPAIHGSLAIVYWRAL